MWITLTNCETKKKIRLMVTTIAMLEEYKYGTTDKGDPIYGTKVVVVIGNTREEIYVAEPIDSPAFSSVGTNNSGGWPYPGVGWAIR